MILFDKKDLKDGFFLKDMLGDGKNYCLKLEEIRDDWVVYIFYVLFYKYFILYIPILYKYI